jgi:hypothetical protein
MFKNVAKRFGRFTISGHLMREGDARMLSIIQLALAQVIVVDIRYDPILDVFEYKALSLTPVFDIVPQGAIIPEYKIIITEEPNRDPIVTFEKACHMYELH